MKKPLIVLFFSLIANVLIYGQVPYIGGRWNVSNGSELNIRQQKTRSIVSFNISWSGYDSGFFYDAKGRWSSRGYFEVNVKRESRTNGCITYLFMIIKLDRGKDNSGTLEESAKDNKCDLRIGYKSKFTIKKR